MIIETGIDFGAAQAEAAKAMAPAPEAVYTLQVNSYEAGETKKGQARLMWKVSIVESADPAFNGKNINHFTNLPDNGNMTGVGFLIDFLNAVGCPWEGSSFDPDIVIGKTCRANVGISEDGKWNNVVSFV